MKADWQQRLQAETEQNYFQRLWAFVEEEYSSQTIFPPKEQVFAALELTGYAETKVVILGQDPYHGRRQAHGLSFSVVDEQAKYPPSLRNICKELEADLQIVRTRCDLTDWARQGVLLLNTVLTVREGQAASHRGKGWEKFTDAIISHLGRREAPVIFVLWGGEAKKKQSLITNPCHHVLVSAHPSPLSAYRGFLGSKPFSQINALLRQMGKTPINWGGPNESAFDL